MGNSLRKIIFVLLSSGVGYLVGHLVIGEYNPPWERYQLESVPSDLVKIEFVDIKSFVFDPTGDILYVSDIDGIFHTSIIFQNEWSVVETIENREDNFLIDCTSERLGPTDFHLWDNPPVAQGVIDSAGVIFERPVSTIVRCYTLLDDGSLEVWVHSGNAMDFLAGEILKIIFAFISLLLGVIINVMVKRHKKRTMVLPV